jgi:hypothetical protein
MPRATVETLAAEKAKGVSLETVNHYVVLCGASAVGLLAQSVSA